MIYDVIYMIIYVIICDIYNIYIIYYIYTHNVALEPQRDRKIQPLQSQTPCLIYSYKSGYLSLCEGLPTLQNEPLVLGVLTEPQIQ